MIKAKEFAGYKIVLGIIDKTIKEKKKYVSEQLEDTITNSAELIEQVPVSDIIFEADKLKEGYINCVKESNSRVFFTTQDDIVTFLKEQSRIDVKDEAKAIELGFKKIAPLSTTQFFGNSELKDALKNNGIKLKDFNGLSLEDKIGIGQKFGLFNKIWDFYTIKQDEPFYMLKRLDEDKKNKILSETGLITYIEKMKELEGKKTSLPFLYEIGKIKQEILHNIESGVDENDSEILSYLNYIKKEAVALKENIDLEKISFQKYPHLFRDVLDKETLKTALKKGEVKDDIACFKKSYSIFSGVEIDNPVEIEKKLELLLNSSFGAKEKQTPVISGKAVSF